MTADQLNKMQQDAMKRHRFTPPVVEVVEKKEKSMSEVLNENFDFIDGELRLKKKPEKQYKKVFHRDLMADQLSLPCTSEKTEEIPVIKTQESMSSTPSKPYEPKPKKIIVRSPVFEPDPPKENWERPKGVYDNSKSPYGIYDELKKRME